MLNLDVIYLLFSIKSTNLTQYDLMNVILLFLKVISIILLRKYLKIGSRIMKKNNKGFTLIELLVVVAIIGILAAVGVVAYSGYTSSAKKSSAKSNHATVLKYIAAEVQKCNIGETSAMKKSDGTNALTCSKRKDAGEVSAAATAALSEFKNAYGTVGSSALAIFDAAAFSGKTACTTSTEGRTNVKSTTTQVTISTCIASGEAPLNNTSVIE